MNKAQAFFIVRAVIRGSEEGGPKKAFCIVRAVL